ncbi:N-acetylmuramoyl-L-alanine amidase [Fulvivirga imtechensis AK7]|uniref:N-acetylmuramoyl-L-alanine amidase n=1 Tax=Fulvivirga imtechensis AK7 TaxID=1237149 RepID=L8JNS1_9BACT|nr:N-acetylmuramoyl-L-alanine amidase [Fulvivirga imtechensis]ELR69164.1 N-acetylmuramoyl-L-alanine amidase [Fulvivirga imtechensis AK7]
MKRLTYLVIHSTDTPQGREVTAAEIRDWHTSPKPRGRGWKQVGYSDIIHLNGDVTNLVPYDNDQKVDPWEITNGVAGINSLSRHVVYSGGKDPGGNFVLDTRTAEQRLSLANYVRQTIAQHPRIKVAGHNQFTKAKKCPSFNVPQWLRAIGVAEKNIYNGEVNL